GTAAPGLTQAQLAAQLPRGPGGPGAIKYPERASPVHVSARARPAARVRRRKLMAASAASRGAIPPLARVEPPLLGTRPAGGLVGGLVMFFVMAGYNASAGMGFLTILNVCFAAWVFRGTAMPAGTMGESPMPAHTAMASPMPGHSAMVGAMPTESAMAGHA